MDLLQLAGNLISALAIAVGGYMWARVRKYNEEQMSFKSGMRALLKSAIINIHARAQRRGSVTYAELAQARDLYDAYHSLGGNGTGTALMKDLNLMPKSAGD